MSDAPLPRLNISARPDLKARAVLLARLQTAQLLKMSEPEIAKLIQQIEKDPYFERMVFPPDARWKIVRFQPHPHTRLAAGFYELDERTLPSGTPADVVRLVDENRPVLAAIRRLGVEKFETYFLKAENSESAEELAKRLTLSPQEVSNIRDFLLEFSVQAEFFDPSSRGAAAPGRHVVRLARMEVSSEGEVELGLMSPHLARGRYNIEYDRLKDYLELGGLKPDECRHVKALVRRLELVNWRQNALFRILDFLSQTQKGFLQKNDPLKRRTITQRQLARTLSVSPSTVNRAIRDRSVVLPWGEEALLEELFCSRKNHCLKFLSEMEAAESDFGQWTDEELRKRLEGAVGFSVPRRTVNTYRNLLES